VEISAASLFVCSIVRWEGVVRDTYCLFRRDGWSL